MHATDILEPSEAGGGESSASDSRAAEVACDTVIFHRRRGGCRGRVAGNIKRQISEEVGSGGLAGWKAP